MHASSSLGGGTEGSAQKLLLNNSTASNKGKVLNSGVLSQNVLSGSVIGGAVDLTTIGGNVAPINISQLSMLQDKNVSTPLRKKRRDPAVI